MCCMNIGLGFGIVPVYSDMLEIARYCVIVVYVYCVWLHCLSSDVLVLEVMKKL